MPSYLQYKRQLAVLDADDTEIESWITVKGNHIPIMKGQSKEDAVKSFLEKKDGGEKTVQSVSGQKWTGVKLEGKYHQFYKKEDAENFIKEAKKHGYKESDIQLVGFEEEKPKNTFLSNQNTLKEFANHFGISESVAKAASEKFGDSFYHLMTKDPKAGVGIAVNYKDYTKEDVEKRLKDAGKQSKETKKKEPAIIREGNVNWVDPKAWNSPASDPWYAMYE